MTVASAPGKCILFGEHAVLYGSPAVAVAIDSRVRIELLDAEGGLRVDGARIDSRRHPHVRSLLTSFGHSEDAPLDIRIESGLFPAAGLGSSAALSVAAAAALTTRTRDGPTSDSLDRADLVMVATAGHEAEAAAQGGRASPTDTATATHGGCILVDTVPNDDLPLLQTRALTTPDGERFWAVHSVPLPDALQDTSLVIGWTGIHSSTAEMVSMVADLLGRDPSKQSEMERIGQVARMGVDALREGHAEGVGAAMEMCQVSFQ